MILVARIGGSIEVCLDDEAPGTLGYTPEYVEDLAHRLGRQAVGIYEAIPARHMIAEDAEDEA